MVIVDKDHSYYGRNATGNVRLTEGEVSRLYERRRGWEVDREALLDGAIARAPLDPRDDFGYLHLVARPVVPDEDMLDRAKGDQDVTRFLNGLFSAAVSDEVFPRRYGKGYSPEPRGSNVGPERASLPVHGNRRSAAAEARGRHPAELAISACRRSNGRLQRAEHIPRRRRGRVRQR
jgi:hypothetical protein